MSDYKWGIGDSSISPDQYKKESTAKRRRQKKRLSIVSITTLMMAKTTAHLHLHTRTYTCAKTSPRFRAWRQEVKVEGTITGSKHDSTSRTAFTTTLSGEARRWQ